MYDPIFEKSYTIEISECLTDPKFFVSSLVDSMRSAPLRSRTVLAVSYIEFSDLWRLHYKILLRASGTGRCLNPLAGKHWPVDL